jgi:hypothetical protein
MKVSIPETHYATYTVPDGLTPQEAREAAKSMMARGEEADSIEFSHADEKTENYLIDGKENEPWQNYGDSNDELPFGE